MGKILEILEQTRANIDFIIDEEDSLSTAVDKLKKKLASVGMKLQNKGYEILEFKETCSLVAFDLRIVLGEEKEKSRRVLVLENENFSQNILQGYKKAIELFLVDSMQLDLETLSSVQDSSSGDESITRNQLSFLMDKMEDEENEELVANELRKIGVKTINDLTKKQASAILDSIQPRQRTRKKRRY